MDLSFFTPNIFFLCEIPRITTKSSMLKFARADREVSFSNPRSMATVAQDIGNVRRLKIYKTSLRIGIRCTCCDFVTGGLYETWLQKAMLQSGGTVFVPRGQVVRGEKEHVIGKMDGATED